jgi:hypothetical protein
MLQLSEGILTYALSRIEKLGALSRSPKARAKNLKSVEFHENPWTNDVLRGIRAPGTGFPFVIMLGTMRHRSGKDFCVIYRRNPVLLLEFENEPFSRWAIPASEDSINLLGSLKPDWQKVLSTKAKGLPQA